MGRTQMKKYLSRDEIINLYKNSPDTLRDTLSDILDRSEYYPIIDVGYTFCGNLACNSPFNASEDPKIVSKTDLLLQMAQSCMSSVNGYMKILNLLSKAVHLQGCTFPRKMNDAWYKDYKKVIGKYGLCEFDSLNISIPYLSSTEIDQLFALLHFWHSLLDIPIDILYGKVSESGELECICGPIIYHGTLIGHAFKVYTMPQYVKELLCYIMNRNDMMSISNMSGNMFDNLFKLYRNMLRY